MGAQRAKVVMWIGVALAVAGIGWWVALRIADAGRADDCEVEEFRAALEGRTFDLADCLSGPSATPAIVVLVLGLIAVGIAWAMSREATSAG